MEYFQIANSSEKMSRVILGGHEYLPDGRSRGFNEDFEKAVTPGNIFPGFGGEERRSILKAAYDLGINVFDVTLDAEKEALGRNLAEMPPPYPVYVQTRPEGMVYGYDPGNRKMTDVRLLREEVQRCLRLLRRETLDILNLGILGDAIAGDTAFLETLAGNVARLKEEGLIRHAAADTFSGEAVYQQMLAIGAFSTINVNFNLVDDGASRSVFATAHRSAAAVVVREALIKGELFRLGEAAGLKDRALLARAATKWVAGHLDVDAVIVGAATVEHLHANVSAFLRPKLDGEEEAALQTLQQHVEFVELRATKRAAFFGA